MSKSSSLLSSLWKHPRCRVGFGLAGLGILFVFLGGKDLLSDASNEFSRWVVYFGVLFSLAGTLLVSVTRRKDKAAAALGAAAVTVRGRVGSVKKDWLSQGYALQYGFVDSMGKSYRSKTILPQQEAFTWRDGEEGEVRYDTNDPSVSVWIGRRINFGEDEGTATCVGTVIEVSERNLDDEKDFVVRYRYRDHLGEFHEDQYVQDESALYKVGDPGKVEFSLYHPALSEWLGKTDDSTTLAGSSDTAPATNAAVDKPVFVPGSGPSTFQLLGRSQPLKSASLIFVYILITGLFLLLVAIVKETPSRDDMIGVSIYSAIVIGLFLWFVRKLWTGIEEVKDWKRIVNCGAAAQGTVNIVEEKRQSLGRWTWNAGWIVSYRYSDRSGRSYSGDSGYLSRREAARWRSRDKCVIVYDPERPEKSVWIGRTR